MLMAVNMGRIIDYHQLNCCTHMIKAALVGNVWLLIMVVRKRDLADLCWALLGTVAHVEPC